MRKGVNREMYLTADQLKEVLQSGMIWQGSKSSTNASTTYSKYFNKDGSLVMITRAGQFNKKVGISTGSYKIINKGGAGYLLVTYNKISQNHPKTSRFNSDNKDAYAVNTVITTGPYKRVNSMTYSYTNDLGDTKTFAKREK